MRIAIIHPDLGIGGAERLIVDAAIELKKGDMKLQFILLIMIQIIVFLRPNVRTFKIKFSQCLKLIFVLGFNVVVVGDWLPHPFSATFIYFFSHQINLFGALFIIL